MTRRAASDALTSNPPDSGPVKYPTLTGLRIQGMVGRICLMCPPVIPRRPKPSPCRIRQLVRNQNTLLPQAYRCLRLSSLFALKANRIGTYLLEGWIIRSYVRKNPSTSLSAQVSTFSIGSPSMWRTIILVMTAWT